MGVKTPLTLTEAQKLFEAYAFKQLVATKEGVIDTTYIVHAQKRSYILKKYERDIQAKIDSDSILLQELNQLGLNVPQLLAKRDVWYLYTKLKGTTPKNTQLRQMQELGRFLRRFHNYSKNRRGPQLFIKNYPLEEILREIKTKHYFYYNKLSSLAKLTQECQGFIHGDIFKDNTLFYKNKLALFDFIDGGCGSFAFELGVVLISFNPQKRKSFTAMLLKSYNQKTPKKIALYELEQEIKNAAKLYALLRIWHHSNTNKAKKLAKLW